MIKKGQVSSVNINNRTARVTFQGLDHVVTAELPYARHVSLNVGDTVAVSFFTESMQDGLIIATF